MTVEERLSKFNKCELPSIDGASIGADAALTTTNELASNQELFLSDAYHSELTDLVTGTRK